MLLSPQIEAAKLAWAGAKVWIKLVLVLALLAALAFAIWRGVDAIYEAGKTAQREADQAAEYKASQLAAQAASDGRSTAYAVTDASRKAAEASAAKVTNETATTRKGINDAFQADPSLARPCTDDGRAAAVPAGVRQKLEAQRAAAEGRSPAR